MSRRVSDAVAEGDDRGFSFSARKNGDVVIVHHGRVASTLRGGQARDFLAGIEKADARATQHRMARLTGNYKRGNERPTRRRGDGS